MGRLVLEELPDVASHRRDGTDAAVFVGVLGGQGRDQVKAPLILHEARRVELPSCDGFAAPAVLEAPRSLDG